MTDVGLSDIDIPKFTKVQNITVAWPACFNSTNNSCLQQNPATLHAMLGQIASAGPGRRVPKNRPVQSVITALDATVNGLADENMVVQYTSVGLQTNYSTIGIEVDRTNHNKNTTLFIRRDDNVTIGFVENNNDLFEGEYVALNMSGGQFYAIHFNYSILEGSKVIDGIAVNMQLVTVDMELRNGRVALHGESSHLVGDIIGQNLNVMLFQANTSALYGRRGVGGYNSLDAISIVRNWIGDKSSIGEGVATLAVVAALSTGQLPGEGGEAKYLQTTKAAQWWFVVVVGTMPILAVTIAFACQHYHEKKFPNEVAQRVAWRVAAGDVFGMIDGVSRVDSQLQACDVDSKNWLHNLPFKVVATRGPVPAAPPPALPAAPPPPNPNDVYTHQCIIVKNDAALHCAGLDDTRKYKGCAFVNGPKVGATVTSPLLFFFPQFADRKGTLDEPPQEQVQNSFSLRHRAPLAPAKFNPQLGSACE
ncbi:hypothetical protein HDV00_011644 [Rhizophlyctis rosea]|nr:hypothetical protein HDV00_011644 [Rhizophlyctis rosea]